MDEVNPDIPKISQAEPAGLGQPIAITVFGMLNIAIGGLSLFTSPCKILGIAMAGETYGMTVGYTLFLLLIYLVGLSLYAWLLSLGMGLIMLKKWARRGSFEYACVAIVWWVVRAGIEIFALSAGWINPIEGDTPVFIGRMCLSSVGFIYPALLLYFMQTKKVRQAFQGLENPKS